MTSLELARLFLALLAATAAATAAAIGADEPLPLDDNAPAPARHASVAAAVATLEARDDGFRGVETLVAAPFLSCRRVTTSKILGYYEHTSVPVREAKCSGFCLSLVSQPHECRPVYTSLRVTLKPSASLLSPRAPADFSLLGRTAAASPVHRVRYLSSCQCRPKRCVVDGTTYDHGATIFDGCNRRCRCHYGQVVDCCRQRKDLRWGMTALERQRYADAVHTVSTTAPYKAMYDALVAQHMSLFGSNIHSHSWFLPWHRAYILQLENLLQQVDCRVTVPYWSWATEASDPLGSAVFGATTFGGDGDPDNGNCVKDGRFGTDNGWTTTPSNGAGCLRRNFANGATMSTWADLQSDAIDACPAANAAGYDCFREEIEHGAAKHDAGHCIINGQMCSTAAANDPMFFLHHCFVDRVWARWQAQSNAHRDAFDGNPNTVMPGSAYSAGQVLNLQSQPGGVRVCYVDPIIWWWVTAVLDNAKVGDLTSVARVRALPEFTPERRDGSKTQWARLLAATGLTDEEIAAKAAATRQRNGDDNPFELLDASRLKGVQAALGLDLPPSTLRLVGGRLVLEGCIDDADTVPDSDIPPLDGDCPDDDKFGGDGL